ETLAARGAALLESTPRLLVEALLSGREFTVPVIEAHDGALEALPVIEIRPTSAVFFDYEAKYTPGAADEICPAPISDDLRRELQTLALNCHEALRCRGYSRTDMMLDDAGVPKVLETNTLPGLTPESLLPKSAAAAGITFDALVAQLLERALA
ncbi:MAG: D-alanine-D-alanine ligase, partial [Myxococcota bacterium]